jgi:REP element-mobilizing transposase RayT
MANTYTQLYVHTIFAVRDRDCLILPDFREKIYKYISGLIQNKEHRLFIANAIPDHIHLLLSCNPDESLSSLIKEIKRCSTIYINDNHFFRNKFEWQSGFGAFSVSKSQVDKIYKYIQNQEIHHRKITFREEYISFLKKYDVVYDERYIFKDL